jgi:hypothetical protein
MKKYIFSFCLMLIIIGSVSSQDIEEPTQNFRDIWMSMSYDNKQSFVIGYFTGLSTTNYVLDDDDPFSDIMKKIHYYLLNTSIDEIINHLDEVFQMEMYEKDTIEELLLKLFTGIVIINSQG